MGEQSPSGVVRGRSRRALWGSAAVVVGTVAACLAVAWVFLSLYASRHHSVPIAQDTLKYIWRTKLTEQLGFGAVGHVPAGTTVEPDRPGLPALASIVHAVTGVTPFRLMFVIGPVAAVLIGLAAGALMVRATGEPTWAFPVYALAVGASVNVTLMAVGYLDNLLATAVLLAAAAAGLLAADGRRGVIATGLLLVGAVVIHWQFALLFVAILGGVTVLLLPESLLVWRRGRRLRDTPSVRLGAGVAAGTAIGGLALLVEPGQLAHTNRGSFLRKLNVTVHQYRFGVVGPGAAAGVAAMAIPPRTRRLRTLALLLVWAASALAAYVLLKHGQTIAAHRFIAFALAIPILATATVVGLARGAGWLAGRFRGGVRSVARVVAAIVGGVVVLGALFASTAVSRSVWYARAHPALTVQPYPSYTPTEARAIAEAARAGAYVARDGQGLPVIYVVQANSLALAATAFGIVRLAVPADQIPRSAEYVGMIENLLAGRPTLSNRGTAKFDNLSRKFWAGSKQFADRAIVIALRSFDRGLAVPPPPGGKPPPGRWIAKGVWLVRGPTPSGPIPDVAPPVPPGSVALALTALGFLALVAAAGSGWAWLLLDDTPTRVALAPAFGIVVLALAGVVVDRAGARLTGGVGVAVAIVVAALGWAWLPVTRWRRGRAAPDAAAGDTAELAEAGVD